MKTIILAGGYAPRLYQPSETASASGGKADHPIIFWMTILLPIGR